MRQAGAWRIELAIAVLLTLQRLAMTLALVLLLLASYAWWGSNMSPLAPLWRPALGLLVFWFVAALARRAALKRLTARFADGAAD